MFPKPDLMQFNCHSSSEVMVKVQYSCCWSAAGFAGDMYVILGVTGINLFSHLGMRMCCFWMGRRDSSDLRLHPR